MRRKGAKQTIKQETSMASKTDRRAYTNRHTWVLPDEDKNIATVGITDYLTEELVAIQSIDMPLVGDELEMDTFCIHLHLAKRIHHLRSPLSGRVVEINKDVQDNPSLLHLDPFKNWLYRMEFDDPDELEMLMDINRYTRFIDQL
jgi:glycine cleavage system H protein